MDKSHFLFHAGDLVTIKDFHKVCQSKVDDNPRLHNLVQLRRDNQLFVVVDGVHDQFNTLLVSCVMFNHLYSIPDTLARPWKYCRSRTLSQSNG